LSTLLLLLIAHNYHVRARDAGVNLRLLSMALAGFSTEPDSLWHSTCASLSAHITHPYLRACFAFLSKCSNADHHGGGGRGALTKHRSADDRHWGDAAKPKPALDSSSTSFERSSGSSSDRVRHDGATSPRGEGPTHAIGSGFDDILFDTKLTLRDRIAFASRYLSDTHFTQFLGVLKEIAVSRGLLEGVLLTGLTLDGVALFQSYINRTCDIQTAVLVMSHVVPSRFNDQRVSSWVQWCVPITQSITHSLARSLTHSLALPSDGVAIATCWIGGSSGTNERSLILATTLTARAEATCRKSTPSATSAASAYRCEPRERASFSTKHVIAHARIHKPKSEYV